MEHIVQLARGGQLRAATRVCLTVWWCARGTGVACRISSLLQAAAGSIFSPPPAPMGWEREGGGWGGVVSSRRVESQRVQTQWWGAAATWWKGQFLRSIELSPSRTYLFVPASHLCSPAVSGPTCSIFCKSWGFEVCPLQRPTKQLDDHEALCRGDCANKMCGSD